MKTIDTFAKVKNIALMLMLLCPMFAHSQSEKYRVIKIQGEIQRVKTGLLLSTGDDFLSDENLNFKTDYSRAAVINAQKGRFILTAGGDDASLTQFLPPSSNMSVRSSKLAQPTEILDYFFGDILILGENNLDVDESKLNLGEANYFEISFNAQDRAFTERLKVENGQLCFSGSLLQKYKPAIVEVAYHDEFGNTQKSEFSPVYPNEQELTSEINVIIANSKTERDAVVKDVTSFLNDFYGKISTEAVDVYMKAMNL